MKKRVRLLVSAFLLLTVVLSSCGKVSTDAKPRINAGNNVFPAIAVDMLSYYGVGSADETVTIGDVVYNVIRTKADFLAVTNAHNYILANDIDMEGQNITAALVLGSGKIFVFTAAFRRSPE